MGTSSKGGVYKMGEIVPSVCETEKEGERGGRKWQYVLKNSMQNDRKS